MSRGKMRTEAERPRFDGAVRRILPAGVRCAALIMALGLVVAGPLLLSPTAARAQETAEAAWNEGDLDRAARLYAERLESDSTDIRALHRLALIRAWNQEFEESLQLFDRLLRLEPDHLQARRDRARVLGWAGHLERAIEELDRVLSRERDELLALEARAQFRRQSGDLSGALSDLQQIQRLQPGDPATARERAQVLMAQSRMDEAAAVYDSLLRESPGDLETRLSLARVLSWSGRLDTARAVYRQTLEQHPESTEARMGLARVQGWDGDLTASERTWRQVLEDHPDDMDARVGLARTLRWEGRLAAARSAIQPLSDTLPPRSPAMQEWRWIEAGLSPSVALSFSYEGDSDENRIATARLDATARITPRLVLRAESHARRATNDALGQGNGNGEHESLGGTLGLDLQLEPGWWIRAGGGGTVTDSDLDSDLPRWYASLSSPGHRSLAVDVSYRRDPLDLTSQLIRNGVVVDELRIGARLRLGSGWEIRGSGSPAWYEGTQENERLTGSLAIQNTLSPSWTLGASYFAFGFDRDLNEGYFDPDYYGIIQAIVRWQARPGDWHILAEANPGLQQVGSDGDQEGAVRLFSSVAYRLGPYRELSLSGAFLSTGMTSFSTDESDYRYGRGAVTFRWAF